MRVDRDNAPTSDIQAGRRNLAENLIERAAKIVVARRRDERCDRLAPQNVEKTPISVGCCVVRDIASRKDGIKRPLLTSVIHNARQRCRRVRVEESVLRILLEVAVGQLQQAGGHSV